MAVQLLPFQKLVDIPDVAQRHRRAICGLAITSIVLVSLILFLAFMSPTGMYVSASKAVLLFIAGPSVMTVFILVLVSSIISLRNTDKWASADVCCNLMRSQPACCTKSCGGNKHRCARLSCVYIAASVFTGLLFLLFGLALFVGCSEYAYRHQYSYGFSHYDYYHQDYTQNHENYDANDRNTHSPSPSPSPKPQPLTGSDDSLLYARATTARARPEPVYASYTYTPPSAPCSVLSMFEVPTLILLLSLVITTARSAWLIRQIEKNQPDIALLPPKKVVALDVVENMMQRIVVGHASVVDDEKPNTEMEF